MAAPTKKPAPKRPAAKAPSPPEAYIIFERMIIPEQNAALLTWVTTFIQQGVKHVAVAIASMGGGVPAAFALYNTLRGLPVHVTMHNVGIVSSAAIVVFVAGDTRVASADASFNFHAPTTALNGDFDVTALRQKADDLETSERRTRLVLVERTGMSVSRIDALKGDSETLDAGQAAELGLIGMTAPFQVPDGVPVVTV
jgi:ATP-dependent protease ClpP protease subunit